MKIRDFIGVLFLINEISNLIWHPVAAEAEATVLEAAAVVDSVAARGATVPCVAEPAATAQDTVRARCFALWVYRIAIVASIPVIAPLPNIAVHVIKTPSIRLLLTYVVRFQTNAK